MVAAVTAGDPDALVAATRAYLRGATPGAATTPQTWRVTLIGPTEVRTVYVVAPDAEAARDAALTQEHGKHGETYDEVKTTD